MSRTIQVRGVNERTYAVLRARAAGEHLSLTAYLKRELERSASRPTMAEWLDGPDAAEPRPGRVAGRVDAAETAAALRALRDAEDPRRSA